MAIHLKPLTSQNIALSLRIYSGVPDTAPAYHHRLDYDASAAVIWSPALHKARIECMHGTIDRADGMDLLEALAVRYSIDFVEWERASGKVVRKRRTGVRRWVSVK